MERAYGFLKQNKDIALATVGLDGKPKIKVFQITKIDEHSNLIYFATAPQKQVFKQLRKNPSIELLAISGNISVRIAGDAIFDVPDA
ncbi:MAG: pyridoxamine 5'-phosphate oxidase family protein, partial [Rikenellaceae bacterium]|nr:pyridoxamine 5'-phosphate oxidase family protein [Rikenellaceae bacterium]